MFRVGLGQDSHRFSPDAGRALVLGGVVVPGGAGLDGNSDADVVLHALCRALEQASGSDGFSRYADAMSRNAINDSREYVKVALANVHRAGYDVGNVGLTIEARTPKIELLREAMKNSVAALLRTRRAPSASMHRPARPDGVRSRRRHPGFRDRQPGGERGG